MKFFRVFSLVVLSFCLSFGVFAQDAAHTLTVGFFQYVPDISAFENNLKKQWAATEPDIALEFVPWDCYSDLPQNDVDVFVYDGIYLASYQKAGYLAPLGTSIPEQEAYPEWELQPAKIHGVYYGIPQMICRDTLFYRKGDTAVANAKTMQELYEAIGPRKTDKLLPDADEGVLADFSIGNGLKYYSALQDHQQKVTPKLDMKKLNPQVMKYVAELYAMTGEKTGKYENPDSFTRAVWFAEGHGRALYAYPEAMHEIARLDKAEEVEMKAISSCEHPDLATAYTDYVSVNAKIAPEKMAAAKKLAAVMTSQPYMLAVLRPQQEGQTRQYLLAARKDVMQQLAKEDPVYAKSYKNLYNTKNLHVITGSKDYSAWEAKWQPEIQKELDQVQEKINVKGGKGKLLCLPLLRHIQGNR